MTINEIIGRGLLGLKPKRCLIMETDIDISPVDADNYNFNFVPGITLDGDLTFNEIGTAVVEALAKAGFRVVALEAKP